MDISYLAPGYRKTIMYMSGEIVAEEYKQTQSEQ